jgi:hypothetical protein
MNMNFDPELALEITKYAVEIFVLLFIIREIRELRRHHKALESHSDQLTSVRPLFTTLYTEGSEIMDLAISSTREAKEIYALGSLASLTQTERKPDEDEVSSRKRLALASSKAVQYVTVTREHILSGRKYCRIMDLRPKRPRDADSIFEILANVNFFLRLLEFSGSSKVDLYLYHSTEMLRGRGDFHFRCSDRQLIIRVGGHGNTYANAAISITDTRVVHEFKRYYESLLKSHSVARLSYNDLVTVRDLLVHQAPEQFEEFLDTLTKVH